MFDRPLSLPLHRTTGLFVDGDNVAPAHAPRLLSQLTDRPRIARVYGGEAALRGWADHAALEPILSAAATPSRNATDMTMALDALHLAMTEGLSVIVLASSDGDFTPLARMLRRLGADVVGMGEAKAPSTFRRACTSFQLLPPPERPSPSVVTVADAEIVAAVSTVLGGDWMSITGLAKAMKERHGYSRETPAIGQWSKWLRAHATLFEFEDRGSESRVRLRG